MRRLVWLAILLLAATVSSFAALKIEVDCGVSVSIGLTSQLNYGPFLLDTVTVATNTVQVANFSCTAGQTGYSTTEISASSKFSINFTDTPGLTSFR